MIKNISRFKTLLFLLVMAALCGGYTAAAGMDPVPGHIYIKANVYDYDEYVTNGRKVPVPNVNIQVSRVCVITGNTYDAGTIDGFITLSPSDAEGTASVDVTYIDAVKEMSRNVLYLGGIRDKKHVMFDGWAAWPYQLYFKFKSASSGYSIDYTSNYSVQWISGNPGLLDPYTISERNRDGKNFDPAGDYFSFHNETGALGAAGEFDIYVKADKVTVSYEDRYIKDWNPADYPSQTVKAGSVISAPSKKPVNSRDADIEFLGWSDKSTGALFDFTEPVTASAVLVPKWGPSTNIQGYIHLDSFLWDHDAYNGTYQTGQTSISVNELKYIIEYYDQAKSSTEPWHTLTTVTVGADGKADFALTPEMMQELRDFYDSIKNQPQTGSGPHRVAIDIGPDPDSRGWHEANHRPLQYAWDWVKYDPATTHGAGLVGVRMMSVNNDSDPFYDNIRDNNSWKRGKNGESTTPVVGNVQYAANQNHVPWLTDGMLEDGFEIYWMCYVAPSMTVSFDLNGGTGTGDYTEQKIKPINSLPEEKKDFLVKNPGGTVTKKDTIFTGWYKVKADGTTETTPWDFANRIVTESMVLRAGFANKLYKVQFVTPESGTQEKQHKAGDTPAWYGQNPTKTSTAQYDYVFKGWKETAGTHLASEYTFHEAYDFEHQTRVIYGNGSSTPVTVDSTFADLTVYTAQFDEIGQKYTVTWLNYDTTQLKQDINVPYGTLPTYDGAAPVRPADEQYTYSFSGWNPSVVAVTGDATYTAVFTPQAISYVITYDANGGVLSGETTQSYNAETDVTLQTAPARDGKIFAGWKLETATGNWDAETYSASQKIGTGKYGDITLVAQWEDGVRDLIIKKKISGGNANPNDRFIFTVTGPDGYSTRVTVAPDSSVTIKGIKVGDYTVKEETDWSFTYTSNPSSGVLTQNIGSNNIFEFTNTPKKDTPVHAEAGVNNVLEKKKGN
ncbi:MAG: InlB B-repeat-containing protein [Spirochaetia bacterium]|nr:InlB B-repeat-containing protein [Spirochaetia bacterium]